MSGQSKTLSYNFMKDCNDFPLKDLFGDLSTMKKKDLKKRVDDNLEKKKKPDNFRILDVNKPNVSS